jgi:hypothetical protein
VENDQSTSARAEELPLAEYQLKIEEAVANLKGHPRHCCRNAFSHLKRAWRLKPNDATMAAFQAITAEEEAASALLVSFKEKKYPGAARLNPRDHVHKSAVAYLVTSIEHLMASFDVPSPTVRLNVGDQSRKPSVSVHLNPKTFGLKTPTGVHIIPDHPLNFSISDGNGVLERFEDELQKIATVGGKKDIVGFIEDAANLRNRLLYANGRGSPKADYNDLFLFERLRRVVILATLTIIIQQTDSHQLFAAQCLRAFLLALKRIETTDFLMEVPPIPEARSKFVVDMTDKVNPKAYVEWTTLLPLSAGFTYGLRK